jgi:hypothetical protein
MIRPQGSSTRTGSLIVSKIWLRATGRWSSRPNRNTPKTSTPAVRVKANGLRSTWPNGPTSRLYRRLTAQGSSTETNTTMLWRRYSRDSRADARMNTAVPAHSSTSV